MKTKVLVTGGAGFLGSHLCDSLISKGERVICLDNLSTGNLSNLSKVMGQKKFEFLEGDVQNPIDMRTRCIFNLACPASPVAYQKNPISTLQTAVIGAMNVLRLAKKDKAKIFQASTSEVYGDPKVHPQTENYWGSVNPIGVRACYDEGKRCAETLFFDYKRQHALEVRVGRIFNTYGPRMQPNDGRVVSNFIVQALNNDPITIYGTGEQTRSFCYVDDLIDGIQSFTDYDNEVGPVNIGNPKEISVHELADTICWLAESKSLIQFKPMPQDDPLQRKPDISKIKDIVGWKPKVDLEDGLKETINYFSKVLNKKRNNKSN